MTGYSGMPLPTKLGNENGSVVVQLGGPQGLLGPIPTRTRLPAHADVVLFFTTERAGLQRRLPVLRAAIETGLLPVGVPAQEGLEGPHRHHRGRDPRGRPPHRPG